MKAKLMALILAAGLGITGIAGTALAAGTNADPEKCKHETTLYYFEERGKSTYYNGMEHVTTYRTGHKCSACDKPIISNTKERYESHDYEMVYYRDGSVLNTCVDCHYTFTAYY